MRIILDYLGGSSVTTRVLKIRGQEGQKERKEMSLEKPRFEGCLGRQRRGHEPRSLSISRNWERQGNSPSPSTSRRNIQPS